MTTALNALASIADILILFIYMQSDFQYHITPSQLSVSYTPTVSHVTDETVLMLHIADSRATQSDSQ